MEFATARLALQDQMRDAYLSLDYSRAEHSAREMIRIYDETGGDPWNEWPYQTAKIVLFRLLNRNPVLKLNSEIDLLRSEILDHGCSLTGQIYA
jgi:hypothetical protein